MPLTRESEYALLGLAALISRPTGSVVSLAEIAAERGLPQPFLAKVFMKLGRRGLVIPHRGRGRGYALARDPTEILVREVLEAVEGPRVLARCLLWEGHCHDDNPCPLHFRMKSIVPSFLEVLETVTLQEYFEESNHSLPR